jgi:hypothetical protein
MLLIFDTFVVNTGVPRAARDDRPAAPKADTAARPFPDRYPPAEPTKSPPPQPAVPRVPDMTEARPIKATIAPRDERDQGMVFYGSFTITGGMVHVVDAEGRPLGSLPVGPSDDVELIVRRLLKDKMAGNSSDFFGRIAYPKISSFH